MKVKWHYLIFAAVLGIIIASLTLNIINKRELNSCSFEINGKILELTKLRNKGFSAKVGYMIDSISYVRNPYIGRPHPYKVGDHVIIQVACEDPETIRVLRLVD